MTSSTIKEPFSGRLGRTLVSKTTEQGLNTWRSKRTSESHAFQQSHVEHNLFDFDITVSFSKNIHLKK